jgi:hypothetical protein
LFPKSLFALLFIIKSMVAALPRRILSATATVHTQLPVSSHLELLFLRPAPDGCPQASRVHSGGVR